MITNEQGQVLLQWSLGERKTPKHVVIDGTDRVYIPTYNHHVCAMWVEPQDVSRLLNYEVKSCNCASGVKVKAFEHPSEINANLWRYGNRYGKQES